MQRLRDMITTPYAATTHVRPAQHQLFLMLCLLLIAIIVKPAHGQILPTFGGDRAGTSGFQFLKIPVDARSAALGQTVVANAFDVSALFWNPALAAQRGGFQVGLSHTSYFADVNLDYAAAMYELPGTQLTIGASMQVLGTDEMQVTTELQPFGTGETFRFSSMAAGLTIAQRLTDLFSYGVTAKLVRESTAGITTNTGLLDLGIFYRVGATGIQMAVAVRNFGLDGQPEGELSRIVVADNSTVIEDDFEAITPPTTFLLGFTYTPFQNDPNNDLMLSAQLNNPNDNAENWNLGIEYTWNQLLILRTGYRFGIAEYTAPSFGLGLQVPYLGPTLRFDYGFTHRNVLGNLHRFGLNVHI